MAVSRASCSCAMSEVRRTAGAAGGKCQWVSWQCHAPSIRRRRAVKDTYWFATEGAWNMAKTFMRAAMLAIVFACAGSALHAQGLRDRFKNRVKQTLQAQADSVTDAAADSAVAKG